MYLNIVLHDILHYIIVFFFFHLKYMHFFQTHNNFVQEPYKVTEVEKTLFFLFDWQRISWFGKEPQGSSSPTPGSTKHHPKLKPCVWECCCSPCCFSKYPMQKNEGSKRKGVTAWLWSLAYGQLPDWFSYDSFISAHISPAEQWSEQGLAMGKRDRNPNPLVLFSKFALSL